MIAVARLTMLPTERSIRPEISATDSPSATNASGSTRFSTLTRFSLERNAGDNAAVPSATLVASAKAGSARTRFARAEPVGPIIAAIAPPAYPRLAWPDA